MINIISRGVGHIDYMSKIALDTIENSNVIIGAERLLLDLDIEDKEVIYLKSNYKEIVECLEKTDKVVSVVVSGDCGFYSFAKYLRENLDKEINSITGISSMQYIFSKINKSYESVKLVSMHGKDLDIVKVVRENEVVFALTDKYNSPSKIALELFKVGIKKKTMYIGSNLSYEDEEIKKMTIGQAKDLEFDSLSVVVICSE